MLQKEVVRGKYYRRKLEKALVKVVSVADGHVFFEHELSKTSGTVGCVSIASFCWDYTPHFKTEENTTTEYRGLEVGKEYSHKVDYRKAIVSGFYEKDGVMHVTYVWRGEDQKSGARPVQSFRDTFYGFKWGDYDSHIRLGERYVDRSANVCVTVLCIMNKGTKVKYEYVKTGIKKTIPAKEFFVQFRPYAATVPDPEAHDDVAGFLSTALHTKPEFMVVSSSTRDVIRFNTADEALKHSDALLVHYRAMLPLVPLPRVTILQHEYEHTSVLYKNYTELWEKVHGTTPEATTIEVPRFFAIFPASGTVYQQPTLAKVLNYADSHLLSYSGQRPVAVVMKVDGTGSAVLFSNYTEAFEKKFGPPRGWTQTEQQQIEEKTLDGIFAMDFCLNVHTTALVEVLSAPSIIELENQLDAQLDTGWNVGQKIVVMMMRTTAPHVVSRTYDDYRAVWEKKRNEPMPKPSDEARMSFLKVVIWSIADDKLDVATARSIARAIQEWIPLQLASGQENGQWNILMQDYPRNHWAHGIIKPFKQEG